MSVLCSVAAYGDYADERKQSMCPEQGFDFDIKLDESDIKLLCPDCGTDNVHLHIRMMNTGDFEDMLLVVYKGRVCSKIPPTDEQIAVCVGISDTIGCSDIMSVPLAEEVLCYISEDQPDDDIMLFTGCFYDDKRNVFDGYCVSVYRYGMRAVEKKVDLRHDVSGDWHVCENVDPKFGGELVRMYKMRDWNTDDPDFAEQQAMSVTDDFYETVCDDIRAVMIDADMPINVGLYGTYVSDPDYHLKSVIDQLSKSSV